MRALKPYVFQLVMIGAFVCALSLSGCASGGSPSGPPPNPIGQQSESSPSSSPSSSPAAAPAPTPSMPRPQFYDFPDIPIPSELSLVPKDSYVFQSGSLKAGLLTLKGRVDINSLVSFFQVAMPREGWKPKGGFTYRRSVLIFEKSDKTCVIRLSEGSYYTYAEIYVAPMVGS